MTWDVTVVCTLAASYLSSSARSAGAAADLAASRKEAKYTSFRLKTYRFSTQKTDMAKKSDDDYVAAAIMHSYSCKS